MTSRLLIPPHGHSLRGPRRTAFTLTNAESEAREQHQTTSRANCQTSPVPAIVLLRVRHSSIARCKN